MILDQRALKVAQDLMERQESQGQLDLRDGKAHVASLVQVAQQVKMDPQVHKEIQAPKDHLVLKGHRVNKEKQDPKEHLVILDQKVHLVRRDQMASKGLLVRLDLRGQQDLRELLEIVESREFVGKLDLRENQAL